ncbi:MAG: 50S ribosomal protein L22 [Candidatus Methanomethylophilaceae archaeon]|nr:50S ribosomal protein L22 [Candidatus Methanomethylophilaceae archaeon]
MKGYTAEADPDTSARAIGKEMPISPKFTREICGLVRGRKVNTAIKTLEGVIALETPVPLKRYNKRVSHKQGVGPGRYPKKAAAAVLGVIKSAVANAEYKGLNTDDMVIRTISASRGRVTPGHMARAHGRATEWNQDTVNLEVIIEEVE